jgi:hypothetical protein
VLLGPPVHQATVYICINNHGQRNTPFFLVHITCRPHAARTQPAAHHAALPGPLSVPRVNAHREEHAAVAGDRQNAGDVTVGGDSVTREADMWGFDAPAAVWVRGVGHPYAKANV